MSSESTLILFGIFVALTPYSGVPTFWYAYILPILGVVIIGLGFLFRTRRVSSQGASIKTPSEVISSEYQSSESDKQQVVGKSAYTQSSSAVMESADHKKSSGI